MLAAFKQERKKYKELKKNRMKDTQSRESQTLAMLAKFQSKLNTAKQMAQYADPAEEEESKEKREEGEIEKGGGGGEEEKEEEDEEMDQSDMSW